MSFAPIEQVLEQEAGSIPELIRRHAAERPRHPALIQDDRRIDFAELDALMDRVAAGLQRDGLPVGGVIAIAAYTSPEYAAVFLGALRAGAVVTPLQPGATPDSLAAMLADSGAAFLFLDAPMAEALASATRPIAATCVALDGSAAGRPLADWLPPSGAPQPVPFDPGATFNIIYSSGTTGAPKGIEQSHRMRWAHVRRGGNYGFGPDAITLVSTPLYSNTTLVSFFPAVALGGTVVLMARFEVGALLRLCERHRVTHAMLVPVQYERILRHPDFARTDLSSFRMKFCTSAPFSAALKAEVLQRWPGGLVEFFGMTEGGGTCLLVAHLRPDKLHTVGQPMLEHDIRIIDDDGVEVAPGGTGEIVGRSPSSMMRGYHNQPAQSAAAEWRDATGQRFIRTGDLGRFDTEGFLTVVGRKKDVIITGGFNVYPADLESVLLGHPAVCESAVVGVPSPRWGETPIAFVVLAAGQSTTAEDLCAWANARLGKTQRLARAILVDSLPRSPIGKILKRELRERFAADGGQVP